MDEYEFEASTALIMGTDWAKDKVVVTNLSEIVSEMKYKGKIVMTLVRKPIPKFMLVFPEYPIPGLHLRVVNACLRRLGHASIVKFKGEYFYNDGLSSPVLSHKWRAV